MPPVVILAGGAATRLYPVTKKIPKAMLELAGKPFIEHQLVLLKKQGVSKVVICAGYLGDQIRDYVQDGRGFGLSVKYSFDGEKLLGTGGALRKAQPLLDDVFFVMYGDSYLDTDFLPIAKFFLSQDKQGLMTVFRNENNWDTSNIVYDNGKIIKYDKDEIAPEMHYIDYGLSLLRSDCLANKDGTSSWDLADLYKELIAKGEMLGYEVKERFFETGSFSGLEETRRHLEGLSAQQKS